MADRQSHTGAPRATSGWTHAQEHVRGSSLASRYWPPPSETRLGRPPLPGSEAGQKPDRRVFPRLRVSAPLRGLFVFRVTLLAAPAPSFPLPE